MKICLNCKQEFKHKHTWQKYCSYKCYLELKYKLNPPRIYCCMDCGTKISSPTALKGNGRCKSCSRKGILSWTVEGKKGKNHPQWKGGLPHCIDCGKPLSFYTCKRCIVCDRKFRYKNNEHIRKQLQKPHNSLSVLYQNIKMRSSWEYIFAYWLDLSGIKWEYEKYTFDLGNTTYTPDFYLPEIDCYIEIKGWWRGNSKDKFKKFLKICKKINIFLFQESDFNSIIGLNKQQLDNFCKVIRRQFKNQ